MQTGPKRHKCVVWDLDGTLWDGVLAEGDVVALRPEARRILNTLDKRGILQSVASKNDYDSAMHKLREFDIAQYFLYPQLSWNPKSHAIATIANQLNVSLTSILFVDDDSVERAEVQHSLPTVMCADGSDLRRLMDRQSLKPALLTQEGRNRRALYLQDSARRQAEEAFRGTPEDFLRTLGMVLTVSPATKAELSRIEELTLRTNQLNSTGIVYSVSRLRSFSRSRRYWLLVATLDDRFGSYGKVAVALIERTARQWTIRLFLTSCRVMTRGVGGALLRELVRAAQAAGVRLNAQFRDTGRNRLMYMTYKFAGFEETRRTNEFTLLEHPLKDPQPVPPYVKVLWAPSR